MQRIRVGQQQAEQGVSGFVVRGVLFLLVTHREGTPLFTPAHLVPRLLKFLLRDRLQPAPGRHQRGLVHYVGEFRPRVSGGAARDQTEIHPLRDLHFLGVHLQNFFTPLHIRQSDGDLTVEAAGTQQRRVQNVGAVGCGDDNDAFLSVEPVHFNQESI